MSYASLGTCTAWHTHLLFHACKNMSHSGEYPHAVFIFSFLLQQTKYGNTGHMQSCVFSSCVCICTSHGHFGSPGNILWQHANVSSEHLRLMKQETSPGKPPAYLNERLSLVLLSSHYYACYLVYVYACMNYSVPRHFVIHAWTDHFVKLLLAMHVSTFLSRCIPVQCNIKARCMWRASKYHGYLLFVHVVILWRC